MFSADTTLHAFPSGRNPRRRHRTIDEEHTGSGGQVPAKRRKRSSITANTFDPLVTTKLNGVAVAANAAVTTGRAREETPELEQNHHDSQQNGITEKLANLAVRNRSGRSSRQTKATRHDEGILLAKTDRYQVAKEMNIPDEVQDVIRAKDSWQARFNEELGQVVLTTHSKAVVWRYTQGNITEALRVAVIKFQNATAPKPRDPLPLGVLVRDTGAGELALLVIKAGGKVVYWESVSSAANADILRQKQNGLHGSVQGLLSGEQVIDIEEGEPDAFLLTTSAGRVMHLSVRDSQGKPAVSTELMRNNSAIGGGVLGSLRSVFSVSAFRKEIAAVRCTVSKAKGHRKCLIITKEGVLQIWDLSRQSNKTLEVELDARPLILRTTESVDGPAGNMQILDVVLPSSKTQRPDISTLLFLVAVQASSKWSYYLIDMTLQKEILQVNLMYPLSVWNQPPNDGKSLLESKPRLLVPNPGHTALIIFDTAVVVASLTSNQQGPDAQLQNEIDPKADAFQDVLYLAKDRDFHFLGAAVEPSSQSGAASALIFVGEYGLAHIAVNKHKETETVPERRANQCKTKLEQVVFFADAPNKLFDFPRAMAVTDWTSQEVEHAALSINDAILDCTSRYVSEITPSMDHQLKDRSAYLKALAKFVGKWNLPVLTRWTLLWSAEKMVAARAVWQVYTTHLAKRDEQKVPFRGRNTVLLWEALDAVSEQYKHEINPAKGENDIVRQFLTRDVARLELLVAWAAKAIEELANDNITNPVQHAWLISQAADVVKAAMDTAYKFREYNAAFYGFASELFEDGIYRGSYKDMPEIWTSCREACLTVPDLAQYAREVAGSLSNTESSDEEGPELIEDDLIKLIEDAVSLARISCQIFEEAYLYQNREESLRTRAENFKIASQNKRRELLVGLVDLMVPDEGLKLAEKQRDLVSLAEITCRSKAFITERLEEGMEDEERRNMETKLEEYDAKIDKYFRDYGMSWAQAFYSQLMLRDNISGVLKSGGQSLSEYLSRNPSLTKAKWIFDVGNQQQYIAAVHSLLRCNADERNLWNKKVQISLAKLSLLAGEEQGQTTKDSLTKQMRHADRRLTTIEIQDNVYNYTHPHLRSAIDQYASVDLAMEMFGKNVKGTEMQAAVFKQSIEELVTRRWVGEDSLIDMLTLIYCPVDIVDDAQFAAHRFFFALQTLRDHPKYDDVERTSIIQKIVWRRAVIQDDWTQFNITELKSDDEVARDTESTALFRTLLAGFHDGLLDTDLPPPQRLELLLGVGTTVEDLRSISRWANLDDSTITAIASDYAAEDAKLQEMLEKGRLGLWWKGLVSSAKTELERRVNGPSEAEDIEDTLVNGTGVNGHVSDDEEQDESQPNVAATTTAVHVDDQGDVVMG